MKGFPYSSSITLFKCYVCILLTIFSGHVTSYRYHKQATIYQFLSYHHNGIFLLVTKKEYIYTRVVHFKRIFLFDSLMYALLPFLNTIKYAYVMAREKAAVEKIHFHMNEIL